MTQRNFAGIAMELALLAAGHRFPRLSQIGAAWGEDTGGPTKVEIDPPIHNTLRVDTPSINGYSFFLLDVTLTDKGAFHLIEANGSNAALSSSVHGFEDRRARHMYLAFNSKRKPRGSVVVILTYQKGLLHIAEYFSRAGIFAERLAESHTVRLCNTEEALGDEEISVVCGTIPEISDFVERKGATLYYKDRPIMFACNPNLLPELVRRKQVECFDALYNIDDIIFHEGRCTPIVHDKALQQQMAVGTNIKPLRAVSANNIEECLNVIDSFRTRGEVAVGKMNAGSGGAGIEFFTPSMGEQDVKEILQKLVTSAVQKYGAEAEKTLFPIRFFEFAKSTPYEVYGKQHLWDMRMQCLIYPGYVEVTPCVIRLCPEPFDGTYSWNSVVSNLTGRNPEMSGRFMRSPAAMRRSQPGSVLDAIGVSGEKLQFLMEGCAQWCAAAWRWGATERSF